MKSSLRMPQLEKSLVQQKTKTHKRKNCLKYRKQNITKNFALMYVELGKRPWNGSED